MEVADIDDEGVELKSYSSATKVFLASGSVSNGMVNAQTPANVADNLTREKLTFREREDIDYERIVQAESLPELEIVSTLMGVYSEEEIRKVSVVDIDNPDISDPYDPSPRSLYDPLMGSIFVDRSCSTCQAPKCLGHFGRIPFASPIPHPMWIDTIRDILTSVCNSCGRLLISESQINLTGYDKLTDIKRISAIAGASKGKLCQYSNQCPEIRQGITTPCRPNPVYLPTKKDENYQICYCGIDKMTIPIVTETILEILSCIPEKDTRLLGFKRGNHPRDLMMQSMIVTAVTTRQPYINNGENMPNQLTESYRLVVQCANKLKLTPHDVMIKNALYLKVKSLMQGKKQKYKQMTAMSGIVDEIQSKKSMVRRNLMGKRTNACARSVVGPDTSLKFGQIRIPVEWADILVIPEKVNRFNINQIKSLHRSGKLKYIKNGGGVLAGRMRTVIDSTIISIGDTVFRHLRNGDVIIINRQPTLHKFSMMAFRVVLGKDRNIGEHMSITTPLNSDHDGDELNAWLVQNVRSVVEAMIILDARNNGRTPAKNKPTMGLIYDSITSASKLSLEKELPYTTYLSILSAITTPIDMEDYLERLSRFNIPRYSGRAVFSLILPRDLNYNHKNVIIIDGIMVDGYLTKEHVGPSGNSIVSNITLDYGPRRFEQFITDGSYILNVYISAVGLTIGISDCMIINNRERRRMQRMRQRSYQNTQTEIDSLGEPPKDPIQLELYEKKAIEIINQNNEKFFALNKPKKRDNSNNMRVIIEGGAKGKELNWNQIHSSVGQQFLLGKRLTAKCGERITPDVDVDSTDLRSRGYVKSNFMEGLTPEELFHHQKAGREGIVDTAINVQVIGDIHRKIVKALENLLINANGAVTDAKGVVIQLCYGGDGLDPARMLPVKTVGSEGNPVPNFVDVYSLARDYNTAAGWIPMEQKFSTAVIELSIISETSTVEEGSLKLVDIENYFSSMDPKFKTIVPKDQGYYKIDIDKSIQSRYLQMKSGKYVLTWNFGQKSEKKNKDMLDDRMNELEEMIDLPIPLKSETVRVRNDEENGNFTNYKKITSIIIKSVSKE